MQTARQQLQQQLSPPSQRLRSTSPNMLGTCHLGPHNTAGAQRRRCNAALAISAAAGAPDPASCGLAPAQAVPAAGAPQTRLQQQAQDLLALDVECAHFRVPGQRRMQHLPAEVCLVDGRGHTVLRTHCNPLTPERAGWQFVGGVPVCEWEAAPPLVTVRAAVAAAIRGRVLVGHNLPQDLATLGLTHQRELQRDTMRYQQLQSGRKRGQRLQVLSEEKLGKKIQEEGRRHDPREDALAALELYTRHVHLDPAGMGFEDLVEHHLAEILGAAAAAPSMDASGGDGEDCGEGAAAAAAEPAGGEGGSE